MAQIPNPSEVGWQPEQATKATPYLPPSGSSSNEKDFSSHGHHMEASTIMSDQDLARRLDSYSLASIVELKISRFLEQIGTYYPEDLHALIMRKAEKPLLNQILRRTGGNQGHAARILGINRNTLRKKMKMYGFC